MKIPTQINVRDYHCPRGVVQGLLRLRHAWLYTDRVLDRDVEVTFAANDSCDDHFKTVLVILRALLPQTHCRVNPIRAAILLSDHLKVLPVSGALDEDNVNTGYAHPCMDIVVYREEEWRKVFIHECFHLFQFDSMHETIAGTFRVPVEVRLEETFCEVWARILNCTLSGPVGSCLEREKRWACFQMVKVLDYMGLTYQDILDHRNLNRYKEKTNVFAYIILGAILLHDAVAFLEWSGGFNAPKGLATLVQALHRTPEFLAAVAVAERAYAREKLKKTDVSRTMRMTIT